MRISDWSSDVCSSDLEMAGQRIARERRAGAHGEGEPEPGRFAFGRRLGQDEEFLEFLESVAKPLEIASAGGDEAVEVIQLGMADSSLHVGDLQVVAQMGVYVFVIVAPRPVAEHPVKAVAARVVLPRIAEAVAAPVADRFQI